MDQLPVDCLRIILHNLWKKRDIAAFYCTCKKFSKVTNGLNRRLTGIKHFNQYIVYNYLDYYSFGNIKDQYMLFIDINHINRSMYEHSSINKENQQYYESIIMKSDDDFYFGVHDSSTLVRFDPMTPISIKYDKTTKNIRAISAGIPKTFLYEDGKIVKNGYVDTDILKKIYAAFLKDTPYDNLLGKIYLQGIELIDKIQS